MEFVGVPLLGVAAGAIGGRRRLTLNSAWEEPSTLFTVIVGPPGSAKTPMLKHAAAPLNRVEREAMAEFTGDLARYKKELARSKESKGVAGEPEAPRMRRLVVGDATVESVGPILAANPLGLVQVCDEASGLVARLNQYKAGGKGGDQQFYLEAWSAGQAVIDRKQQAGVPIIVPAVHLSIVGGIQPDLLGRLRHQNDGFMDRFLLGFPDPWPAPGYIDYEAPAEHLSGWHDMVRQLLALEPKKVGLTEDGRGAWAGFLNAHAAEMNGLTFPEHLSGPWSKLKGYGARLALVLHTLRLVTKEVEGEEVDAESVRRAVALVDYFKSHARKAHAALGSDPRVAGARKILGWVCQTGLAEFSRHDAHRALAGSFHRACDLDPALELLVEHGFIRPLAPQKRAGRGRPKGPQYEINPYLPDTIDEIDKNRRVLVAA
jgi:hypothetical protein